MKLNTGVNSAFPDQMVSEEEKRTLDYGLLVGQAIEYEWFRGGRVNGSRWNTGYQQFHNLRLYASCLLYTSPSPRDVEESRMPSSA